MSKTYGLSQEALNTLQELKIDPGLFNKWQLRQISDGIASHHDITLFADPAFQADQMYEILKALNHVDRDTLEPYVKPSYSAEVMNTLFGALQNNDQEMLSKMLSYANHDPAYNDDQLRMLAQGLRFRADTTLYDNPNYSAKLMASVEKYLEQGISSQQLQAILLPAIMHQDKEGLTISYAQLDALLTWPNKGWDTAILTLHPYESWQIARIERLIIGGEGISQYIDKDYDALQLMEIADGRAAGLDVSLYQSPQFSSLQMRALKRIMRQGLDASIAADPKYTPDEIDTIGGALAAGIDLTDTKNPVTGQFSYNLLNQKYSDHAQMEHLVHGFRLGCDISLYSNPEMPAYEMLSYQCALEDAKRDHIDTSLLYEHQYTGPQAEVLIRALSSGMTMESLQKVADPRFDDMYMRSIILDIERGTDTSQYITPAYNRAEYEAISHGIQHGIDVSKYAMLKDDGTPVYNANQMRCLQYGLENNLDISLYSDPAFSAQQMDLIYSGLKQGLDVSSYADSTLSVDQMQKQLNSLQYQHDKANKQSVMGALANIQSNLPQKELDNWYFTPKRMDKQSVVIIEPRKQDPGFEYQLAIMLKDGSPALALKWSKETQMDLSSPEQLQDYKLRHDKVFETATKFKAAMEKQPQQKKHKKHDDIER